MTYYSVRHVPILLLLALGLLLPVCGADREYKVKSGDTIISIARLFGVSPEVLQQFNDLANPSLIKVGQKLRIPAGGKEPEADKSMADSRPVSETYVVESGDTLWGIARKTGIPRGEIMSLNGFDNNSRLKTGQKIRLPARKSPGPSATEPVAKTKEPVKTEQAPVVEKPLVNKHAVTEIPPETMLELSDYKAAGQVTWPAAGEQFASSSKLPGILIKSKPGEDIRVVCAGTVIYSLPHSVFGHVVIVESPNGYLYFYGGNAGSNLVLHQQVKAGDLVGQVGLSPGLKEYYVYFSVSRQGKFVDPARAPRG